MSRQYRDRSLKFFAPSRCPNFRGIPRLVAHLPLPSIIKPTCCGSCSGSAIAPVVGSSLGEVFLLKNGRALLNNYQPAITSLQFDPRELGMVACKLLVDFIEGNEVKKKTHLGYELRLKESTK